MFVMGPPEPEESLLNWSATPPTILFSSWFSFRSTSDSFSPDGIVVTISLTLSITGWFMIVVVDCEAGDPETVVEGEDGVFVTTYTVSGSGVNRRDSGLYTRELKMELIRW